MSTSISSEKYFEALKILIKSPISPLADAEEKFSMNIDRLSEYVSKNELKLAAFESQLLGTDNNLLFVDQSDVSWTYVVHCLQLLFSTYTILKSTLKQSISRGNPSAGIGLLNVSQQNDILSVVQFVVALGILPCMKPGVCLPVSKRSSSSKFLKNTNLACSDFAKHERLIFCIEILLFCIEDKQIGSFITARHLVDILSCMCQLCFVPLKKQESETSPNTSASVMKVTNLQYEMVVNQRQILKDKLDILVKNTYKPLIVQSLLTVQTKQKGDFKTPKWLQEACGSLLTQTLLSQNGIVSVVQAYLGSEISGCVSNSKAPEWQKCESISSLISTCPKNFTIDSYFEKIAPQLLFVMRGTSDKVTLIDLVVCSVINRMSRINHVLTENLIVKPILEPMRKLTQEDNTVDVDETILMSYDLVSVIFSVKNLLTGGSDKCPHVLDSIMTVFVRLFSVYSYCVETVSNFRSPLTEILKVILTTLPVERSIRLICDLTIQASDSMNRIKFTMDDRSHIYVVKKKYMNDDWLDKDQKNVAAIVGLLSEMSADNLTCELFLSLLKNLSTLSNLDALDNDDAECCPSSSSEERTLLDIEMKQENRLKKLRNNLSLLNLIGGMCETFGSSLLVNKSEILKFCLSTLERGVNLCKANKDDTRMMVAETLTLVMSVITVLMDDQENLYMHEKAEIFSTLDNLDLLACDHPSEEVRKMARELKIAVATQGVIWFPENKDNSAKYTADSETIQDHINVCEKSDGIFDKNESKVKKLYKKLTFSEKSKFQAAWEDLNDPLLPVRGHALIALSKLVRNKDSEALKNKFKLLVIFQENLKHEDSYIYLTSIQGLSNLATIFPSEVVQLLTEEFVRNDSEKIGLEEKLKIGEVLVKTSVNLGEMIPKYRDVLLNALLAGLKDSDSLVRSSSLSNIAEVCKYLRFSIGPYLQELLQALKCCLSQNEDIEVRGGALVVIRKLFEGLGVDTLKVLEHEIHDLYRELKKIYEVDKEETIRLHAQTTLEVLNELMKRFLFPEPRLEKKIVILD